MKKIFFILLLFTAATGFAKESYDTKTQFESYSKQTSKEIEDTDVMKDVEAFATLELDEKIDLNAVKNVIKTLIKLDETDPSRTAAMMLGSSYGQNTRLYKKAFKALKTPKNKIQLEEIESLMKNFSKLGNG